MSKMCKTLKLMQQFNPKLLEQYIINKNKASFSETKIGRGLLFDYFYVHRATSPLFYRFLSGAVWRIKTVGKCLLLFDGPIPKLLLGF